MSYLELLKLAAPEAIVLVTALVVLDDRTCDRSTRRRGERVGRRPGECG